MLIKAMRFPGLMMFVLSIALLALLAGCGSGGLTDAPAGSSDGGATTLPPVAGISLGTDATTVKSDNSDSATITAIALDSSNAVIEGVTISFSATGGAISASSAKTDASGKAVIKFSSGTLDQSNQVVTITAAASGKTAQIPLQVVGATLTMTSTTANLPSDGSGAATLTVLAKNAGGVPVRNMNIALAVSGAGSVTLSATTGTTDVAGKLRDAAGNEVTVKGALAGTATVTAQGMGTTASLAYTVSGPAVGVFSITAPTMDLASCSTASTIDVEVAVPDATATPNVTFATTLGVWDGGTAVMTKAVNPATKKVKATLSSLKAGLATVQAYNPLVPATTDSMGVAFYAPASTAAQISLQSGVSVLGLSTGGLTKTTTLTANVRNVAGAPVGEAAVAFSIANPTGGGEFISPVVAYTQPTGLATATFTSGSVSSGAKGVQINAQVVGAAPVVAAPPIAIVIGGTAGSVVIGPGSKITVLNATTYSLPMSVLVADSSGSAVAGATVSLKMWPVQYSTGAWYNSLVYDPDNPAKVLYKSYITGTFDNDDVNENLIRDSGENSDPYGALRPPNSAAGSLPATVTTDANGVANFNLTYLKGSAVWIKDRIRASALVLGTETTSSITFTLPAERTEAEAGELPDAAYPVDLTVAATAGATVTYTMPAWSSAYLVVPATATYSTLSSYSTINSLTRVYTFTAPAGVKAGDVYQDYITASDGGKTSSTSWIRIIASP